MSAKQRRSRIIELLSAERSVNIEDLAQQLDVSASTIRRDLGRLAAEGNATRTYGGAVVSGLHPQEASLQQRALEARAEKDAIGRWAASQVHDGETVFIDAGTTAARVAHHIRTQSLTVITNSLTALTELADADSVEVLVLGGRLRRISQGLVGPLTDMSLARLTADRAFLGADGLVADHGICEADTSQTYAKELMAARSTEVYVVADSSKVGYAPFTAWAPLERSWTLVTDDSATPEQLQPFRDRANIRVVVTSPSISPLNGSTSQLSPTRS